MEVTTDNVGEVFRYHKPLQDQLPKFDAVNEACKAAAIVLLEVVPRSPLRTRALNALMEARMLSNASIALEHVP